MPPTNKMFGSERRTQVLIMIALLEDTYPTELAQLLDAPLYSVQKIIDALDLEGVIVTRLVGNSRVASLDPRFYASKELRAMLLRLAEGQPGLKAAATRRRSRPRRSGKPL